MERQKREKLDLILRRLGSFAVAFSGGVDSSFLLYHAHSMKDVKVTGVTISTPYIPDIEIKEAVDFTKTYGISHSIVKLDFPESIRYNPSDRCYLCKKMLFSELRTFAENKGFKWVIEGTNADDSGEYRPGLRALRELDIKSPLMEAGITKKEIREYSLAAGLPTWDKPAMACLLTRIPHDTRIEPEILRMIEKAETFLSERGFAGARVRVHDNLARIECLPSQFDRIVRDPEKEVITDTFKKIGFRYISLDLEGYRSGSFNPETRKL
jgi:pyridinium-3,5-biscarboxylic acid mononucleotide sulfurtransferase